MKWYFIYIIGFPMLAQTHYSTIGANAGDYLRTILCRFPPTKLRANRDRVLDRKTGGKDESKAQSYSKDTSPSHAHVTIRIIQVSKG